MALDMVKGTRLAPSRHGRSCQNPPEHVQDLLWLSGQADVVVGAGPQARDHVVRGAEGTQDDYLYAQLGVAHRTDDDLRRIPQALLIHQDRVWFLPPSRISLRQTVQRLALRDSELDTVAGTREEPHDANTPSLVGRDNQYMTFPTSPLHTPAAFFPCIVSYPGTSASEKCAA